MKTIQSAIAAGVTAIFLAACGGSPTSGAAEASTASFDNGYGMGSGNREAPADSTDASTTTSGDTTARGGYTIGSGN